ncbi:DMT family transporter [Massilia terrae]|uniref:DMT family transporter n=1 Tax=Massilia terrae TaxID=1811224 RepID=A0ABT2CZG4_9BURK|nr:DMT family transporter [Massilia terrae]MCS0659366.1 DMT family transporter [Massilia terrae]
MHRFASQNILLGVGAGVLAGAFWGLVFLTPELTRGFLPIQLSAGRYLAYGAIAAALLAPSWRRVIAILSWKEWRALCWLSFTGNIIYYVFLANAVRLGGVAMTSLVIGMLPVTVTLVGSRDHGAVPLARLLPSLVLSAAGLVCISWPALSSGPKASFVGLLCAIGSLVSWTTYAVGNSRWLDRLSHVTAHEWSLLTGVVTGAQALLLAVPAFLLTSIAHTSSEWLYFAGVMSAVALFCSVIGNALWNRASRLLPLTMSGQLIVFETLFALLYGFLWEARWPTALETLAMVLLVAGVLSCASAHRPSEVHAE